ncbi:deacylase [Phyllobacterium sp. 628]|uniref:succinylglutamate desuccinylase/aspartoacylase family protein n=1 Tax=Phyllobacterium sp. 628 TaxID=2718938 RepID=UPI00166235A5|nr:succinylglutamate desuccinylase/aspartoacylase family protein [Phyllobacterium sp. 628]QND52076.1 deacylase [Phyllobacterium sp. 628]
MEAAEPGVQHAPEKTQQMGPSRIWTDINFDAEGRQFGYLRLNVSTHGRGAAFVPIPVASFKNGPGARILLLAGVHGDEYEGQVMLMKLMRTLDIANVRGQILILSATNTPAVLAGTRTSPLDGVNLNRAFPGNPNGSPTEEIAFFISNVLLPRVEYLLDFHSGEDDRFITPTSHIYHTDDRQKFEQLLHMMSVFGMPKSTVLQGLIDHDKKAINVCDRLGVLRFATELGGGGGITLDALRLAETGLARLLFDLGVLRTPITDEPAPPTDFVRRLPNKQYVYAMASGIFEPFVKVGQDVHSGQEAGAIHFPEEPWRDPWIAKFSDNGTVYAIRTRARTEMGDNLFMLSVPWSD